MAYTTMPWGSFDGEDSTDATTYTTFTDRINPYQDQFGMRQEPYVTKYNNIHSKFEQFVEREIIECRRYEDNKYKFNYNFDLFEEATRLIIREYGMKDNVDVIHIPNSYLNIQSSVGMMPEESEIITEKHTTFHRVILKNFQLDKLQLILKEDDIEGTFIYAEDINGRKLKVATVDESNIVHIHLSFLSIYNGEGVDLFMRIFNQAIKIINNKKESFSLVFEKALNSNVDKNKIKIKELMKQISDSQKKLEKAKRSYKLLSKLYQNPDMREDSIRSFEVMEKDKRIDKIKVKNNLVYVFTNNIKVDLKKAGIFDIGKYEIVYNLLDGDIKVFNQKKIEGNQHPHINSEGRPCWGNMSKDIPILLAKLDLVGLTHIVLKYLESYHDGDTHVNMFNFMKRIDPSNDNINNLEERVENANVSIMNGVNVT